MPASSNKRLFYAIVQAGLKADGDSGAYDAIHGVQSVGMSTNFNLSQVFELGQIAIYQNREELPDIEISVTKVLDGYPLAYHLATQGSTTTDPTLAGRSNSKAVFGLAIFPDTNNEATGSPLSQVECSGMFPSRIGYTIPLTAPMTEDLTLVGNNKVWVRDPNYSSGVSTTFTGAFTGNADVPLAVGGVSHRQHLIFDITAGLGGDNNGMYADPNATILPQEVFGISTSGINLKSDGTNFDAHVSEISVSTDLGRDAIFELGRLGPYHRYVTFPVAVDCAITVTSTSGDMISATEGGILSTGGACGNVSNLRNRTIRIATCDGTRIYLGLKNKLASVEYTGGDATGGNVQVTYNFQTFNDFTVMHSGDPHASGAAWWAARTTYLVN